jgi:hypothetical protein
MAVYVLARWEGPSVFCVEKPEDSCTTRARVGSYDAFVFLSPLPLDEGDLKAIDYQQNIWGAENRVLNVLRMSASPSALHPLGWSLWMVADIGTRQTRSA